MDSRISIPMIVFVVLSCGTLSMHGCAEQDSFGPEDDPPPGPTEYRIVLPDSISICRDDSWSFTAELLPYPQSADTAVFYSWTSTHRAGRLYLDYYTEYYAWTSASPDAYYRAEYFARFDTLTCTAALQVGSDLVPVAADTIFVRVGHPSIIDAGVLHGEIVWNETNTFYNWSVYVIYPLEPGYSRYLYAGEGFNDQEYWGTELEYIGPPFGYGSLIYEDEAWFFLTGGSAAYDPDFPEAPATNLDLDLARFDGGIWTIRPLCDAKTSN